MKKHHLQQQIQLTRSKNPHTLWLIHIQTFNGKITVTGANLREPECWDSQIVTPNESTPISTSGQRASCFEIFNDEKNGDNYVAN